MTVKIEIEASQTSGGQSFKHYIYKIRSAQIQNRKIKTRISQEVYKHMGVTILMVPCYYELT